MRDTNIPTNSYIDNKKGMITTHIDFQNYGMCYIQVGQMTSSYIYVCTLNSSKKLFYSPSVLPQGIDNQFVNFCA